MKIAVTGYGGMLKNRLLKRGCLSIGGDITKREIEYEIKEISPDVIIHCAAMTDVNACEKNKMEAFKVNVLGTSNLIEYFQDGLFIYISSSHVFDGMAWYPYSEKHIPNPINIYGTTKYAGEVVSKFRIGRTIVIRISKLFSEETLRDNINILWNGGKIEASDLIRRSYTYVEHAADAIMKLISIADSFKGDTIHIASETDISEYQFWLSIANVFGIDYRNIISIRKEQKQLTPRPLRASFHCGLARTYGIVLPETINGIREMKGGLK